MSGSTSALRNGGRMWESAGTFFSWTGWQTVVSTKGGFFGSARARLEAFTQVTGEHNQALVRYETLSMIQRLAPGQHTSDTLIRPADKPAAERELREILTEIVIPYLTLESVRLLRWEARKTSKRAWRYVQWVWDLLQEAEDNLVIKKLLTVDAWKPVVFEQYLDQEDE